MNDADIVEAIVLYTKKCKSIEDTKRLEIDMAAKMLVDVLLRGCVGPLIYDERIYLVIDGNLRICGFRSLG